MNLLINANSLAIPLPDKSVQCVVTSPPYWGLRDYGVPDQLGLEKVPDCLGWATGNPCGKCYVCHLVSVFREVWRVLRDDGTLFLNLGDSYSGSGKGQMGDGSSSDRRGAKQSTSAGTLTGGLPKSNFLKPKDLIGIPWRVALALQADGWWLRSEIIWHKLNPMPESITDRPTKSHEQIFLLTKSKKYFWDKEAVKEPSKGQQGSAADFKRSTKEILVPGNSFLQHRENRESTIDTGSRNLRDVWTMASQPTREAHFATYPEKLVDTCIKAGTSERGCCPICGAPWKRLVKHTRIHRDELSSDDPRYRPQKYAGAYEKINGKGDAGYSENITLGFQPTCTHNAEPVPCIVFDPFIGSGTTGLVAKKLGRNYVGTDLSFTYLADIAKNRINIFSHLHHPICLL